MESPLRRARSTAAQTRASVGVSACSRVRRRQAVRVLAGLTNRAPLQAIGPTGCSNGGGRLLLRDAVAETFPRLLCAEGVARSHDRSRGIPAHDLRAAGVIETWPTAIARSRLVLMPEAIVNVVDRRAHAAATRWVWPLSARRTDGGRAAVPTASSPECSRGTQQRPARRARSYAARDREPRTVGGGAQWSPDRGGPACPTRAHSRLTTPASSDSFK